MTHSRTGSTGVGDHGIEGLSTFVDQHECTSICAQLDLENVSMDQLVAKNSGGGGEVNVQSDSEDGDGDHDE